MGTAEDEARAKAIGLYRILAAVQILLGIGLLVCGGFGTTYTGEYDFGPPYFLGGFLVGSAMLASGLISTCVFIKAVETTNDVKKREVACGIMGQYILCMFIFMMCFMGLIFAGISSCDTWTTEDCPPERDIIRYCILALTACAIPINIFNMYIVCTYGSYFGVVMRRGRRGRMVMSIDTTNRTGTTGITNANTFAVNNAFGDARTQQLQRENELLQRQLELQRQINQQNQPGGTVPPPPPPNYGYSQDVAYPPPTSFPQPSAPPPPYGSNY